MLFFQHFWLESWKQVAHYTIASISNLAETISMWARIGFHNCLNGNDLLYHITCNFKGWNFVAYRQNSRFRLKSLSKSSRSFDSPQRTRIKNKLNPGIFEKQHYPIRFNSNCYLLENNETHFCFKHSILVFCFECKKHARWNKCLCYIFSYVRYKIEKYNFDYPFCNRWFLLQKL